MTVLHPTKLRQICLKRAKQRRMAHNQSEKARIAANAREEVMRRKELIRNIKEKN